LPVCGNTFLMLQRSRFAEYFDFYGDFEQHFGIFPDCGTVMPFAEAVLSTEEAGSSCC